MSSPPARTATSQTGPIVMTNGRSVSLTECDWWSIVKEMKTVPYTRQIQDAAFFGLPVAVLFWLVLLPLGRFLIVRALAR